MRGNVSRFILFVKGKVIRFGIFLIIFLLVAFAIKAGVTAAEAVVSAKRGDVVKDVKEGFVVEEFVIHMFNIKPCSSKCQRKEAIYFTPYRKKNPCGWHGS